MMKKIVALMLLTAMLIPLHAGTDPGQGNSWDQEVQMMTFIVNDVVYAGFSPSVVTSFVPVKTGFTKDIGFRMESDGEYVSDVFYIYCLASTKGGVKLRWGDTYGSNSTNMHNTTVQTKVTMSQRATLGNATSGKSDDRITVYPVMKNEDSANQTVVKYAVYDYSSDRPVADWSDIDIKANGTSSGSEADLARPYVWCAGPYYLKIKESGIPENASGSYKATLYLQVEVM